MPCCDPGYAAAAQTKRDQEKINKINQLTKLLCDSCRYIEDHAGTFANSDVYTWWSKHKESKGHEK